MFQDTTYINRRKALKAKVGHGLILLFGNDESPMNYTDNTYHFRQDSTFLYYFGIQRPGLIALIDIENDNETIYGDEYTVEDSVWMGPQPTLEALAGSCGVAKVQPISHLSRAIATAKKTSQPFHFLPLYRAESKIKLQQLLDISPDETWNDRSTGHRRDS